MNISIFGLGYVGAVSAACLAARGHNVWGVDINHDKVDMINNCKSPVIEPFLEKIIQTSVASGRLEATTISEDALTNSELCFVAVSTPSKMNGQLDSSILYRACHQIAEALNKLKREQIVVIRSSVLPSIFTECRKIFQEHAPGLVELCVNPEFLREGTAIEDFEHPPFTIIGTSRKEVAQKFSDLYEHVEAPIYVLNPDEAIMIKYISNVYHGMKVAFANEVGELCRAHGIDSHEVMKVFGKDKKLNISAKYLKPGFAFGGSCLPKDIRAVLYAAKENDVELPLIQNIISSNNMLIEKTIERILSYEKKKVGLIGLSFKNNTDDLRESPFAVLAERLIGKGIELSIYDPNVSLARLTGLNKAYINEVLPHISRLLVQTMDSLLNSAEIIIVGHNFEGVSSLTKHIKPSTIIMDFCNIRELKAHTGKYEGISW